MTSLVTGGGVVVDHARDVDDENKWAVAAATTTTTTTTEAPKGATMTGKRTLTQNLRVDTRGVKKKKERKEGGGAKFARLDARARLTTSTRRTETPPLTMMRMLTKNASRTHTGEGSSVRGRIDAMLVCEAIAASRARFAHYTWRHRADRADRARRGRGR